MNRRCLVKIGLLLMMMLVPVASVLAVYGDIVFKIQDEARDIAPAVFPHWIHRIRYKCYACHPALFEMKAGANPITMDALSAGEYCGKCHNGKTAWGIGFDTCNKCHYAE